jgi:Zn-dependent membrane protease YugP
MSPVLLVLVLVAIFGPQLWIRLMFRLYREDLPEIPGTGGELARHLINRFGLYGVVVEETRSEGDHYSPQDKAVRLSPENLHGRSLTAIAVAAHEVGHAIQFHRGDPTCKLFTRYVPVASAIQRVGIALVSLPVFALAFQLPRVSMIAMLFAAVVMLSAAFVHMIILPQEWDASFNKALPILEQGRYVDERHLPAIRRILRAAAFTYVASALTDIFRCWRWGGILRGLRL